MTYPDSVSLVKPPNTTRPNTLAALPSNQYATILLDTLGKKCGPVVPAPTCSAVTGVCSLFARKLDNGAEWPCSSAKTSDLCSDARVEISLNDLGTDGFPPGLTRQRKLDFGCAHCLRKGHIEYSLPKFEASLRNNV